jgi:hypothetical protein
MSVRSYLPSKQFSLLVFSLFASVGLVYAAQYVTKPKQMATLQTADQVAAAQDADWQATLDAIQAQSGVSLPTQPDADTLNGMRQAAQSANMTDTVARSLLVNLTNAKSQGLGDDAPTQDQLISQAVSQMKQAPTNPYTQSDLTVVADTKSTEHAYGNALATVFANNKGDEYDQTLTILDNATSQSDASQLQKLQPIAAQYAALTKAILEIPVPQTLVPFQLQLVNNFKAITDSYSAMAVVITDPLQGLTAMQTYQSLTQQTSKVFTNIAQAFNKDGILFTSGEPGASWAVLLSGQ